MEINSRKCKVCMQIKIRIEDGKYPNNRDKRWKDEDGLLWNGSICGSCNRGRSLANMNKLRNGFTE